MLNSLSANLLALRSISTSVSTTAHNIANFNTDGFKPQETLLLEKGKNTGPEAYTRKGQGSLSLNQKKELKTSVEEASVYKKDIFPSESDLSSEISKSIKNEFAYKANASILSSQDEHLATLISIKV